MLNYINKSVYLPKMAPLKWGCRGVEGVWDVRVLEVCGGYYGNKDKRKGTPTWDNTYQMKLHVTHTFVAGDSLAHVGRLVKLSYLSWSAGVSCKTWSHMCWSWYFTKFLLSEYH